MDLASANYDDLAYDEEIAHEREVQEGEVAEYQRILEFAKRAAKSRVNDLVKAIIAEREEPLDDIKEHVDAIIEYCVGPESEWSSGTGEAHEFSRLVAESYEAEWHQFQASHPDMTVGQATQRLPPKYFAMPLPPAQHDALVQDNPSGERGPKHGAVRARIQYHDNHGSLCSMVREILFTMTANAAIEKVVGRIHEVLNVGGVPPSEYCFKVVGRNDFLYGPEPFINFRYIRDCVVKQNEICLYVMRLPFPSAVLNAPRFRPLYAPRTAAAASASPERLSERNRSLSKGATPSRAAPAAGSSSHHDAICSRNYLCDWSPACSQHHSISSWEVNEPLQLQVTELSNLTIPADRAKIEGLREGDDVFVCVIAELCFGGRAMCAPQRTAWRCLRHIVGAKQPEHVHWTSPRDGRISFDVRLCDVPREIRLCVTVMAIAGDRFTPEIAEASATKLVEDSSVRSEEKLRDLVNRINPLSLFTKKPEERTNHAFYLANVNAQVFDHTGQLRMGTVQDVRMWSGDSRANPIAISTSNPDTRGIGCGLSFPMFAMPVYHPVGTPPEAKLRELEVAHHDRLLNIPLGIRDNKIAQLRHIKRILAADPLYNLTPLDRILLWEYRADLTRRPKALPKLLLAVDWMSPAAVSEGHALMRRWAKLRPVDALELLDARYADTRVREYAVTCLDTMPDNELRSVLLQLVQVLKYEPYHYSALARFLLRRSLASPHLIGHTVFWHLKAEMYNAAVAERHGALMVEYLRRLQSRRDVLRQVHVVQLLLEAALKVKESKKDERLGDLRDALHKIEFPPSFTLALNPTMECVGLQVSKCKVMDSKKLPLWLVFRNADPLGANVYIMFKAGDDLRQDLLTLQMLELMDNVWKGSGLDLHMIPYGCVATGEGVGMIEIVLRSDTIANITKRDGGAHAAFSQEPLMNWLRKYNRTPAEVEKCLWNFVYSTAGYCVATYILGIGDRHNDNIMVREDGTLFHIDFGHFLGNFKTKFGFKRETAPFIFTPMYAYMMGGPTTKIYDHFTDVACEAFNVIRRQSNLLITLFMLMLSTGIPELQRADDISWLKSVLLPDGSDEQASKHYRTQIQLALENKRTLINDYVHIVAHS